MLLQSSETLELFMFWSFYQLLEHFMYEGLMAGQLLLLISMHMSSFVDFYFVPCQNKARIQAVTTSGNI